MTPVDKDGRMVLVVLHLGTRMPDPHGLLPDNVRHEHILFR
ncbi:hypothetical protein DVDV_1522 [Desulfovibrio sp. DV]|nr:hypothetical protein DVDV_1522 [Desulfovibrio sp. DV]